MKKETLITSGILIFALTTAVAVGSVKNTVDINKERVEKIEDKYEQDEKEETERVLKQAEIDTRQTTILENLDYLIKDLERRIER